MREIREGRGGSGGGGGGGGGCCWCCCCRRRRKGKKEEDRRRRRARRDQNYPTRNSSLPISAEIIKREEGTRCTRGGREEKEEEGERDRIEGGAGVALLENDGSIGNRQKTTMGPYEMRRKTDARRRRRERRGGRRSR